MQFTAPENYPPASYVRRVPVAVTHAFTAVQAGLGSRVFTYGVNTLAGCLRCLCVLICVMYPHHYIIWSAGPYSQAGCFVVLWVVKSNAFQAVPYNRSPVQLNWSRLVPHPTWIIPN